MTVTRSYGILVVSSLTAGTLYLDGKAMGELPAGAEARLDNNVEVGDRGVELRYEGGGKESKSVTVRKGQVSSVSFSWKKATSQASVSAAEVPAGMVLVPGGSFTMGSPAGEVGRYDNEVQHQVSVSSFYIGATEVTQAQYKMVMSSNPSKFQGDDLPVESVSWYDAVAYCNKRSQMEGLSAVYTISRTNVTANWSSKGYRLPTEAEWEFAAKGGAASNSLAVDAVYAGIASLNDVAWHGGNYDSKTHPVGQKKANALGLFDMAGNVCEWCWDIYGNYPGGSQSDPVGASSGIGRVIRGGTWSGIDRWLRSAYRDGSVPGFTASDRGFRLARRP
jgi:formylglycine-generating enzyme required for sulfatase activity